MSDERTRAHRAGDEPTPKPEIDTLNRFMVGMQGDKIAIPVLHVTLTKDAALNLAAYLVCMADMTPEHEGFKAVLAAIENA